MDMAIEEATIEDLARIRSILNDAILNTTAVWYNDPRTPQQMQEWLEMKHREGLPVLVARRGGDVAGYASYGSFRPWSGYVHTVEHSVYVDGRMRRSGVGRLLLRALISHAQAAGYHAMVGGIAAENEASIALHESLGFGEVGRMPEVGLKFGRWLTLVFIQKILKEP
jgi:L-amino acid N-acyltransferase YncA